MPGRGDLTGVVGRVGMPGNGAGLVCLVMVQGWYAW